jgi:glutamyl-tRNA synthetase
MTATSPAGTVRTRIAPSPTGFLHLGTARTALYSWAYARHHGGQFILRIEDTDVERNSDEAVAQIVRSMAWLGLDHDEGPFFQMQRLDRYHAVVERMLAEGTAYRCWCTPEELDAMREAQRARGEKTRYDGTWRPEPGKLLPVPPAGVRPVVRLRNPPDGDVTWHDLVKGPITISNREIDDLIILRPATSDDPAALGVPTYNFAVVVDDIDMRITHVFRGDEHVNNTPWQINIFRALGAPLPQFGHLPVILGDDGLKLSKRRGAVSVTAYEDGGYLPEAMLNYLARLGWSHGDEELFSREQMVAWFDGSHLSRSPAQWDPAKLAWVNAQYLRQAADARLAELAKAQLERRGVAPPSAQTLVAAAALFKDRCTTTVELADWIELLTVAPTPPATELEAHLTPAAAAALRDLRDRLGDTAWDKGSLGAAIKAVCVAHGLKMPQVAVPLRLLLTGRAQTPSIDALLALFERDAVWARLQHL